ncbi:alkane 1-monooxygenase [Rhodococcus erythropolis]|uniref:alkane 1-monooxygenase n=1 Tax=Rhodococcus erythropolis TaxID=1833 RepID=UPI001E4071C2|nr:MULTISPECIES: alkane 1-monooxygenase [Rhodococcus erythropolis group]MCD2104119.1 alkane 1-monooxygenase [Rhodococcus qingshengii]MCZ4523172.1 alkane 1-monooxygenase [Rhodococcus erythropolis]
MTIFAEASRTAAGDARNGQRPVWRDKKRRLWPLGLLVPLSPFAAWFLVDKFTLGLFWAIGAWLIVIVIPLIDLLAGEDGNSPPDEAIPHLQEDRFYRWCTYLFLPLQYLGLVFVAWCWVNAPMAAGEKFALAMTAGVVAGVGINAAHELGHKSEKLEKWLAKLALAQSFYGHFYVEHNHGHHVRVATPEDPASSRYRENFWFFLPRSVVGGLRSGWRIESARLKRQGRRTWSCRNNILNAWAMSVVLFGGLIALFGCEIAPWLAVQAIAGFTFLETANYLEHYGLLRAKRPDGSYVRCSPEDSWNSDHVVSNLFLYQLQRHSDHHANPRLRYQSLRSAAEAPQLPAGYAVMIVCAWVPPLWRKVMDKRLLAYYDGDMTRINVLPGR